MIKIIFSKDGKPHRYRSKHERLVIAAVNQTYCNLQHRQDFNAYVNGKRAIYKKQYLKAYYHRPEVKAYYKAYQKAYSQTPEYKAYHKAYQKAYSQTPEYKAYHKAYHKAYYHRPEVKQYRKQYHKEYYQSHKKILKEIEAIE